MSPSIEDRLRAHFADRAAREPLPGPESDAVLRQARQDDGVVAHRTIGLDSGRMRARLAIAAAVVVAGGAAGALTVLGGGSSEVQTRNPSSTAETTGDSAPPPAPTSTVPDETGTTQVPADGTTATGPIVAREGVLGSWSGSAWVRWEAGATPPVGDRYQVVRLGDPITTAVGTESVDCSPAGNPSIDVRLGFEGDRLSPDPIAVAGVADPRPRPVEALDTDDPQYRAAAVNVLADLGVTDASPTISQVVRGDVDGDGAAEVLVVAERLSDVVGWTAAEGDYSVAFLRRAVGGDVETTVVASWIAEPPSEFTASIEVLRLAALADLNGDGRMEAVLGSRSYEGSGTSVYELQSDGTLVEVLSTDCGV